MEIIESDLSMKDWLLNNWLAILALIIAFVGGLPGLLKTIEHFRPFRMSGSVKFYVFTQGSEPPEDGIIFALSIVNEGNKNLIWRKLTGKLKNDETTISLSPKIIPTNIDFNNIKPSGQDFLRQQTLLPSIPYNGFLLMVAPSGSLENFKNSAFSLHMELELETGKSVNIVLPVKGAMIVQPGESFPSHKVEF